MVKGGLAKKPAGYAFKKELEGKPQEVGVRFNFSAKVELGKENEYLEMIKVEQNKFLQLAKIAVPDGQENMDPSKVGNMQNLSPITPNDHKSQNQKGVVSFSG
jgi:hypothetical protein